MSESPTKRGTSVVVHVPLSAEEAAWLRTLALQRGLSEDDMLVLAFREKYGASEQKDDR